MTDATSLRCSFCGQPSGKVETLVAAPTANICGECVDICVAAMAVRRREGMGDEALRLRCLELAIGAQAIEPTDVARGFYAFVTGEAESAPRDPPINDLADQVRGLRKQVQVQAPRVGPGLSYDEFTAGRRYEASPQAPGPADE